MPAPAPATAPVAAPVAAPASAPVAASAADRVYRHVKEHVLDRRYEGGTLLTEGGLATAVGVSRTPVREALLRLQAEGLLRLYPKKGALVLPVSAQEIADERLQPVQQRGRRGRGPGGARPAGAVPAGRPGGRRGGPGGRRRGAGRRAGRVRP
ncbi:GntR family transcriptional regulator, partial [Streptomyces sp. WAC05292]|uniref:GntR family transcriptional regulator n=1 Tax=Streptomyces sp. WAC05292 TaxID=2487418 RepID=UPI000F908986